MSTLPTLEHRRTAAHITGAWFTLPADGRTMNAMAEAITQALADQETAANARANAEIVDALRPGNALYMTIRRKLEPFYPDGDRALDWDVLPSTVGALAKAREATEDVLSHAAAEIAASKVHVAELEAEKHGWKKAALAEQEARNALRASVRSWIPARLDEVANIFGSHVASLVFDLVGREGHLYDNADLDRRSELLAKALEAPVGIRFPQDGGRCPCGWPMSRNPHPAAGRRDAFICVGAAWVCIPCAVRAALTHEANAKEERRARESIEGEIEAATRWFYDWPGKGNPAPIDGTLVEKFEHVAQVGAEREERDAVTNRQIRADLAQARAELAEAKTRILAYIRAKPTPQAALNVLRSLEWAGGDSGDECPSCHAELVIPIGHKPSCALDAALKAITAELVDDIEPEHGIRRAIDGKVAVGNHPLALEVQAALQKQKAAAFRRGQLSALAEASGICQLLPQGPEYANPDPLWQGARIANANAIRARHAELLLVHQAAPE